MEWFILKSNTKYGGEMDTNILMVIDWLYKTIGTGLVDGFIRVLFITICTTLTLIMLTIAMAFINLAELSRLPLIQKEKTRESLRQTINNVWPKKNKIDVKS